MAQPHALPSGVYSQPQPPANQTTSISPALIQASNTLDLAYLDVQLVTLYPGQDRIAKEPKHEDLEELIIVKEGALQVTINNTTQQIGPGSVVLVMPGAPHHYEPGNSETVAYYIFQYKGKKPSSLQRGHEHGGSFIVDWDTLEVKSYSKGSRRNLFERPTAVFERFEMHVTTLNKGLTSHEPHQHRPGEFILIRYGEVEEFIDHKLHPASAGDLIFLESESLHTISNTGKGAAEYYAFQLN